MPNEFYVLWSDNFGNKYKIELNREYGNSVYELEYNLKYLAQHEPLILTLRGAYSSDGASLEDSFFKEVIISEEQIDLSVVGTQTVQRPCYVSFKENGQWCHDYEIDFNFVITTEANKILHEYVQIEEVKIPTEYFSCEMQEATADYYDLSSITKMLSDRDTDDYQYGFLTESLTDENTRTTYDSLIRNHKKQGENIIETEQYHYIYKEDSMVKRETYQYEQLKDGEGYLLNETDGVFSCGTFAMQGNSDGFDYHPSDLDLLKKAEALTYKAAVKDGYTYLSISGSYNDYPNRLEYFNVSAEIIYVIKDNAIIAWLYKESSSSPYKEGYWNNTIYCIPLEEDIELVDENLLKAVCQ